MAFSLPHVKTQFWSSPQFLIPNSNISATRNLQIPGSGRLRQPFDTEKMYVLLLKCAKGDSVGRKSEEEIGTEEDLSRIGKPLDKCEDFGGIAELLECLEKEAIMGDDEGKEPMDYNRRAQIFDKSSTVFQALKESETGTSTSNG